MARFDFAFFQLLFRILGRQTGDISRVDYKPQKPHYENVPEEQPFPRATPESQGVSSAYTAEFLQKLRDDPQANPHHVILLRHGKIIAECGFAPYPRDMWHITHSMCKSVTGMAIGLLIEDGKLTLDEKLSDIFSEYVGLIGIFRQSITVENLLDMTSRCEFGEAGAISGNDWRRGFMKAGCKGEPGGAFEYNSMNSYMLSAIVTKKTGMPMFEFLKERLFQPLGITEVFWESCPKGITKGGWGMFLRPEDAAKLGQLYLQKGKWNGVQVIPESWVETSTTKHIDNGEGNFGYGYQVWMSDRPGSFAYNGMLGQDVIVYPDTDMVIVINAGNKEMTQEGNLTEIIRGYFGAGYEPSEEALPENTAGELELRSTVRRLEGKEVHLPCIVRGGWGERRSAYRPEVGEADLISMLKGRKYELDQKQVGLFPLVMQVFHNNFTDGISQIDFREEDRRLAVDFHEGEEVHTLKVGIGSAEISEITVHGEPYYVGTQGTIARDEKERLTLILKADFLEEAGTRKIKLYFEGDDLEVRWNESPGEDIIQDGLDFVNKSPGYRNLAFVKSLMENGVKDIINTSVTATVHPVIFGHLVKPEKVLNSGDSRG